MQSQSAVQPGHVPGWEPALHPGESGLRGGRDVIGYGLAVASAQFNQCFAAIDAVHSARQGDHPHANWMTIRGLERGHV